jgi:hypothetical protein
MVSNNYQKMDNGQYLLNNCCSFCGRTENTNARNINCISETKYWAGSGGNYINRDNEGTWKVFLCNNCMPQARNIYIQNQLKHGLTKTGIGLLSIAGAAALFMVAHWTNMFGEMTESSNIIESIISGPKTFLNLMFMGLMIFILGAGIILVPHGLIISMVNLIRKSIFGSQNIVKAGWINKCIIGESERILKSLESDDKTKSRVFGEFLLPQFKEPTELIGEERKKAQTQGDNIQWKKRRILHKSIRI